MMRTIFRGACSFAICLSISACSNLNELDIDKTADFSSFDSFSVDVAEIPANHESLQGHVDQAISTQLTSKGLKQTSANDAAVNIRYFLTVEETDPDDAETTAPGELIVDVQDSMTGDVVWRSRSERDVPVKKGNESVMAESVQEWVTEMLEQYPGSR